MEDIEVVGLESLARLSSAMRQAGEQGKGLKRELRASLVKETAPVRAQMGKAIVPALPKRGGLAADVRRSTRFTANLATGANPGVRIKARGKRSIRRMNATGSFRHPIFGHRAVWVTQKPTAQLKNFLDRPFVHSRPELQQAVLQALTRVRAHLYRSI